MSEEFDKEAEREKLREQFASEEEDREQTRRMSELLLKGATMTNKHCDRCGDPVFRHDGREFCPSCQGGAPAAGSTESAADGDGDDTPAAPSGGAAGTTDATDATGSEGTPEQSPPQAAGGQRRAPPSTSGESPDRDDGSGDRRPEQAERPERAEYAERAVGEPGGGDRTPPTRDVADTQGTEFQDATEAVRRTIRRFSEAAATTDDPERAREYLETVRDASETLAALRRR